MFVSLLVSTFDYYIDNNLTAYFTYLTWTLITSKHFFIWRITKDNLWGKKEECFFFFFGCLIRFWIPWSVTFLRFSNSIQIKLPITTRVMLFLSSTFIFISVIWDKRYVAVELPPIPMAQHKANIYIVSPNLFTITWDKMGIS